VTALLLVVAVGGVVAWARHDDPGAPRVPAATTSGEPPIVPGTIVHVVPGVGATRFLPLGSAPRDGRTFSAQHAYNALVLTSSKLSPIPATVRAYYGVLHDASASPAVLDVRVWAFVVTGGCGSVGGPPSRGDPTSSPSPGRQCRLWEFVNARTGHDLGVVSQEVLPG
jgi:hypothetical protein